MKDKFFINGIDEFDVGDFGSTYAECVRNIKLVYWKLYLKERSLIFFGTVIPVIPFVCFNNLFVKALVAVWYMLLRRYYTRRIRVCKFF